MTISATTRGIRPGVCTSTTRPTAPFDGMLIYETDTDKIRIWNGSTWTLVGDSYGTATGGTTSTITAYDVSYKLHTFTSSSNLEVSAAGYFDFLLIGAGGGVGSYGSGIQAGGGGGAETAFFYRQYLAAGTYPVVVGAGVGGQNGERTYIRSKESSLILLVGHGGGTSSYAGSASTWAGSTGGSGRYNVGSGAGLVYGGRNANRGGTSTSSVAGGGGGAGTAASGATGGNGLDISLWLGQSAGTTIKGGGGAGTSGAAGTGTGSANTGGGNNASTSDLAGYSGIAYVRSAP